MRLDQAALFCNRRLSGRPSTLMSALSSPSQFAKLASASRQ
jgi:hypothetical protein